jgi:hypothetical protein
VALGSLALAMIACNVPGAPVGELPPPPPGASVVVEATAPAEIQAPMPTFEATQALPALSATSTVGEILAVPSATSVPTLGLVIVADVVHDSGSNLTLDHDGLVDLDTGNLNPRQGTADFQMTSGDDPYLDNLVPMNGSYIGWYGAGSQPGKAGCNILMAAAPMPLNWPDNEDTYYCHVTSSGLTGWLQVHTYVSQPLSERRLIFSYTTYE